MTVELVYKPSLAEYRLSESHPLRPERFVLAVELMRAWGLLCESADASGTRADDGAASASSAGAGGVAAAAPSPAAPATCALIVAPEPAT